MKVASVLLAVAIVVALLWIGGELHRQSCIDAHRTGCSVLPWVSGHQPIGGYLGQ